MEYALRDVERPTGNEPSMAVERVAHSAITTSCGGSAGRRTRIRRLGAWSGSAGPSPGRRRSTGVGRADWVLRRAGVAITCGHPRSLGSRPCT